MPLWWPPDKPPASCGMTLAERSTILRRVAGRVARDAGTGAGGQLGCGKPIRERVSVQRAVSTLEFSSRRKRTGSAAKWCRWMRPGGPRALAMTVREPLG
jgi:acyl-CoA reductase-like NAD-dependent aldehyde dehydrogenase